MTLSEKLDILKVIAAFLTPVLVVIFGIIINRRLEKNKLSLLKEKEFQVRWAELFLTQAIEYNKSITGIILALFDLQTVKDQKVVDEYSKQIITNIKEAQRLEWDMRNYSQFATKYSNDVIQSQKVLGDYLNVILKTREGSFEDVRKAQFEYNKAVRKAHNEILKSGIN